MADRVGPGGAPLSSALDLRIASGEWDRLSTTAPSLACGICELGPDRGWRRHGPIDFTVTLPRSVGNEVEGTTLSAGFTWNAA